MKHLNRRRGTALIIVIAILIMLAIMATAYLSIARIDRQSVTGTGGSTLITSEDPLGIEDTMSRLIGVLDNTLQTKLLADVFGNGGATYRNPGIANNVLDYDVVGRPSDDSILSPRLPVPSDPTDTTKLPEWPSLGGELTGLGSSTAEFKAPGGGFDRNTMLNKPALPTSLRVTYPNSGLPSGLQSNYANRTRIFPALMVPVDPANPQAGDRVFIAADASGGGIADCILHQITDTSGSYAPQAYPGGGTLTYWVGYRVVDNGSAVNLNTAFDMRGDPVLDGTNRAVTGDVTTAFDPTTGGATAAHINFGYFLSNIGLRQLIWIASDEKGTQAEPAYIAPQMTKLLDWRTNDLWTNGAAGFIPLKDSDTDPDLSVIDYQYLTLGEAMEFQSARRLGNPGYIGLSNRTDVGSYTVAQALSSDDAAGLAYGFVFRPAGSSSSKAESIFDRSLLKWAPNYAGEHPENVMAYYPADRADLWWQWNFNGDKATRDGLTPSTAIHPGDNLLQAYGAAYYNTNPDVNSYPVSTAAAALPAGIPLRPFLTTYNPISTLAPDATKAYEALTGAVSPGLQENTLAGDLNTLMPPANKPWVRVSANTGQFGDLWRAYFAVMASNSGDIPAGSGTIFQDVIRDSTATNPNLTNHDILTLRSAIAALNTIDLRTTVTQPNPTVKTITLTTNSVTGQGRKARIFGNKPQVFITEVLVATGGTGSNKELVAIELYNPYDHPISLAGWKLATRQAGVLTEIAPGSLDPIIVPPSSPNGYWIITNDDGTLMAQYTVANSAAGLTTIPALETDALGKELVIVRPAINRDITETTTEVSFMAPVDQFDFSYIDTALTTNTAGMPRWYHYARSVAAKWDAVYPGQWVDALPPTSPNDQHPVAVEPDPAAIAPAPPVATIGDATGYTTPFDQGTYVIPISLDNWPAADNGYMRYPMGGYARDGDILKVPFIGAYTIYTYDSTNPSPATLSLVEMNALPMDAQFATDTAAGTVQQVGRFCPLNTRGTAGDAYNFSHKLFEYLTAHTSPTMDYLPDIDSAPERVAVSNAGGTPGDGEATVGVQGKININTAPWQVLATLPLVMNTDGTVDLSKTVDMAKAIVDHRKVNGAFKSIFELNNVVLGGSTFRDPELRIAIAGATGTLYAFGDNRATGLTDTTHTPTTFDSQYAQLIRLSNLITTRSDTFTVYLLVQAWVGADTGSPVLVGERRMSYIVDRSGVTTNKNDKESLKVITISNN